jgi:outer membrane protein
MRKTIFVAPWWAVASVCTLAPLATAVAVLAQEPTSPPKIAVINVGRLLEESAAGQEALSRLKTIQEQKGVEARGLEQEMKELRDRINDGRLSLSEERLAEMQRELEEKIIAYRRFQDDAQREFQEVQGETFEAIQSQVMPIITSVGTEFGYTLIFNKFESGLVFAQEEVDITNLILERFNEEAGGAAEPKPEPDPAE